MYTTFFNCWSLNLLVIDVSFEYYSRISKTSARRHVYMIVLAGVISISTTGKTYYSSNVLFVII